MIYLLTVIGLPPGGSSTHKQYTERHKHFGTVRAVSRLGELYPYN
jgi:hypothetical protein